MTFLSVRILKDPHGPDYLLFESEFPTTMPKVTNQNAFFELKVAAGFGEAYVKKHFPLIPIKIIKL